MTTLAIISDIHGNLTALAAVLAELEAMGVEQIVCLGDVAATGPQPGECIDQLAERRIPSVLGNADEWLLAPSFDPQADAFHRQVEETDAWCAEQLTHLQRAHLHTFQPILRLDTPLPLLCFHGTPRSNQEIIDADTPTEDLLALFREEEAQVLAGGHTHQQLLRRVRTAILLNPGSVGLCYQVERTGVPRNVPWAEYALLRGQDGRLEVSLRRLPFGVHDHVRAILHSGMPHAEMWAAHWLPA